MAKHFDIIVINPAVSTDRRESVKSQMEKFNVEYEFFNAFDPRRMPADDLEFKKKFHQPFEGMSSGYFGVNLSHYYSVKNWLEQKDSDFLIVFEDDIFLTEKITEILGAQEQLHALPFDILKLGGHISKRGRIAVKIGRFIDSDVVYPFDASMNSVAYILKRSGAKKFLEHLEKFTTTVDVKLFREIKFGFVVLEISPFWFRETESQHYCSHDRVQNRQTQENVQAACNK